MAAGVNKLNSRAICVRIAPNEDLVTSVEKTCLKENILNAFIRGSLGSLTSPNQEIAEEKSQAVEGPVVEILCLNGEVKCDDGDVPQASLYGVVVDQHGDIRAGRFIRDANNVCVTMELIIEEWGG